jgi:hypothetical protein
MSSGLFNSKPLHISQADSFEISIEKFLDGLGFVENKEWSFIGSFGKKEFSGDVDIAILHNDLEYWIQTFEKWGYEFKVCKGFNQISFGFPFEGQIVQVDLMLTRRLEWSKFIYYSPNLSAGESEFRGIYRNLLLSSLIITESRCLFLNGNMGQYILRLNEGLIYVVKSLNDETGKLTRTSRIIEEKFDTNDPSRICEIFELEEPIMTFEQLWDQVKVRPKFEEIKERFEKFCKQSKIEIPNYGE